MEIFENTGHEEDYNRLLLKQDSHLAVKKLGARLSTSRFYVTKIYSETIESAQPEQGL